MNKNKAQELRKYLSSLEIEGFDPLYLYSCLQDAINAVALGETNGNMSDISCSMYLLLK